MKEVAIDLRGNISTNNADAIVFVIDSANSFMVAHASQALIVRFCWMQI
jgi:cell wall assembly regulator SMI1